MLFCLYFATAPAACLSNETDFSALLAFKKAVDVDPLGALRSWNGTVHYCDWEGILCNQRNRGRVVSLNLTSQGLVGSLSPHLGNLSFLRTFVLQNNSFYGAIPEEFGRLRRLRFLDLSNNSFTGEIPRNLSHCSNLYYLDLIDNNLTGIIIPELGSMSKLEALGLAENSLSGTIPPFIGNLTNLAVLSLALCAFHGEIPESLVQLRSLQFISFELNMLSGEIPSGLYNISGITYFIMSFNRLHGQIPWDIGFTLPKLTYFDLGANDFDGPIPVSLSNASLLENVYLFSNKLTGQNLKYFNRLPSLRELLVTSNSMEGDINFISSLTNCTNLETLGAADNLFGGSLPDSIANLSSQLRVLYLGENQIHGYIPPGIQNLIGLTTIKLGGNFLEGPIPSGIGLLSKLQEIYMGRNELTDEIPPSLGNLTLLNLIDLSHNKFKGMIPQSLSDCIKLLYLDFSFNNLVGPIPRDIFSLSSISISLNFAHNAFTGSIPQEVGSLSNLVDMDLSHNRLSEVIPSTLSSCLLLGRLHLENNSFEGNIPDALNALKGLQDLDLSHNNLSGPIPKFLGNELKLKSLNLSFNRLQGEVPTEGVFRNESAISVEGNENLCGGIAFLKLPPCSYDTNSKKKHSSNLLKILIPLLGTGVICLTFPCIYRFVCRRLMVRMVPSSMPSIEDKFLRLSYAELLKATDGFSEANLLGIGRFGSVYRGFLDDKQMSVAVKVLNLEIKGASKSFMSECSAIKGFRHRNLLKLLSVCESIDFQGNNFKALIYEFMANGSLDEWLHNDYNVRTESESSRILSTTRKLNIAIDIANAVEYLHHGTTSIVIHGDLKPSNILLDENMTAHVGDFGLARVFSNIFPAYDGNSSSLAIKGTFGYIPPEYGMTNSMTMQGDVYSFGILMLEMFTSIRPTDAVALNEHSSLHRLVNHSLHSPEMNIVDQITDLHQHTDHNMHTKIKKCLNSVLEIGVACSMESPKDRKTMTDVVTELDKIRKAYLAE
ncbi:receptor-like protein kinase [Dorcoceras hygrometricum]|uniref:non-specific serine/threonine protein kinase n=1 Tax=Dorcoceras hygrometricum TaxID=472368 RepID=A0A2Z7DD46_9LAMI|nr:receptor-like protein kinase [Dorcoceras hygrometricum]